MLFLYRFTPFLTINNCKAKATANDANIMTQIVVDVFLFLLFLMYNENQINDPIAKIMKSQEKILSQKSENIGLNALAMIQ